MEKLIFATNNLHKFKEINEVIPGNIQLLNLGDLGFKESIPEPYDTLEENAREKAMVIYRKYKTNCFADDTGLIIDALDGEPGVFSSRYAGENASFEDNMNKVLSKMKGQSNRKARFKTIICLIEQGKELYFEGVIEGEILESKIGEEGFGYDPIFKPANHEKSFAEMSLEEKNKISHRAIAINKLVEYLCNKNKN